MNWPVWNKIFFFKYKLVDWLLDQVYLSMESFSLFYHFIEENLQKSKFQEAIPIRETALEKIWLNTHKLYYFDAWALDVHQTWIDTLFLLLSLEIYLLFICSKLIFFSFFLTHINSLSSVFICVCLIENLSSCSHS